MCVKNALKDLECIVINFIVSDFNALIDSQIETKAKVQEISDKLKKIILL